MNILFKGVMMMFSFHVSFLGVYVSSLAFLNPPTFPINPTHKDAMALICPSAAHAQGHREICRWKKTSGACHGI